MQLSQSVKFRERVWRHKSEIEIEIEYDIFLYLYLHHTHETSSYILYLFHFHICLSSYSDSNQSYQIPFNVLFNVDETSIERYNFDLLLTSTAIGSGDYEFLRLSAHISVLIKPRNHSQTAALFKHQYQLD